MCSRMGGACGLQSTNDAKLKKLLKQEDPDKPHFRGENVMAFLQAMSSCFHMYIFWVDHKFSRNWKMPNMHIAPGCMARQWNNSLDHKRQSPSEWIGRNQYTVVFNLKRLGCYP